ncbi:MAG: hypothetical protein QM485_05105 [Flavobacteriaceae bacterium]
MRKKPILIACGVLLASILVITNRSNTVDWTPTFNEVATKPLDTKIFYEQLSFWFKGHSAKKVYTTFYEYNQALRLQEKDTLKNYVSISGRYSIDVSSFNSLLQYVEYGNDAFISAYYFPRFVQDTLGFEIVYNPVELRQKKKTLFLEYAKDTLEYMPKVPFGTSHIKDSMPVNVKKLGYWVSETGEEKSNFVGIPYRDGIFYIHTTPEIFTNHQMLEASNTGYISTVISFLSQLPLLFDKAIKIDPEFSQSSLRYILAHESLKWGWYILLFAIGLFLVFNAKRRQRIIPIVEPLKNSTTAFVHTVSNLHYEAQDYNGIVQKAIVHFLEYIRSTYHLSTESLDEGFVEKLALKSGKPLEEVRQLIGLIVKMRAHTFTTKEPLIKLNKEIEKFYNRNKPV